MFTLLKKVAIVTGASSGIGQATAILFARLGSCVALVARNGARLNETREECLKAYQEAGHKYDKEPFICIQADLSDLAQVENAFNKAISHFNKLDILVNNAGYIMRDTVETFDADSFDNLMKTNLRAVIKLTQLAVPSLTESKGAIVNVSSVCGNRSFPGVMSYCISKAALDQFTKCTALDLAPKGIRVNSVNPAVIVTQLHLNMGMSDTEYAEFLERAKTTHALGRPGQTEEVANAIAFLASSAASFTTGDILLVDGGKSVLCPR